MLASVYADEQFVKLEIFKTQYLKTLAQTRDVLARHNHSSGGFSIASDTGSSTAHDHGASPSSTRFPLLQTSLLLARRRTFTTTMNLRRPLFLALTLLVLIACVSAAPKVKKHKKFRKHVGKTFDYVTTGSETFTRPGKPSTGGQRHVDDHRH
ncbi:hypothetical protein EVAR_53748_1 [Eumeta japonica]|uniref:Uncharacterized protein n=1 Tax=Eumeta variegata TaxID=151549 RepID=A0A4C1ZEK5_EUMVA|nr:hypothetical protein EVAR_53748_1 [Eumeta japonica]